MAMFELPDLTPIAETLPKLLRRNGRFIAINLHPAFSKPGAYRSIDILENPNTGEQETRHSIKSTGYMYIPPCSSQAIRGQEKSQTLFHRPLCQLISPFLHSGELMMDRIKELAFEHEPDAKQIQSYHNFPQFPMLVAFRLRSVAS